MLSALGWLYGKIINKRNSYFESGTLKSESLGAPTISVGNITVGGTGKTPLVAYVAEILSAHGEKVCIISRGYKRENEKERIQVSDWNNVLASVKQAGDEPFELANKLLGRAIVISDANRVRAGKWAKEKFGITAFLLDDAFQHLKVKRDLDIVVVDATNPFGNGKPLPSGILREPLSNLGRADAVVISRANLVDNVAQIEDQVRLYSQNCEIFISQNHTGQIIKLKDLLAGETPRAIKPKGNAFAFCGLGNPDNFFDQLKNDGFKLSSTMIFPDHHEYDDRDLENIVSAAKASAAEFLLTTSKDAVKLSGFEFPIPCCVVESHLSFQDEKKLREMVCAVLNK
ncbi:MAG: tetraacyldisaccharide 4'-kinase [Acidobacteria bacterium]|nr:tetraacyldisaccharide 4'-kinase [Acidobacteriota bacterium]